jgi:hypothetical protein
MTRLALALALVTVAACAPVRPWEREKLASRAMSLDVGEEGLAGAHRGGAPGGGCGCTQ